MDTRVAEKSPCGVVREGLWRPDRLIYQLIDLSCFRTGPCPRVDPFSGADLIYPAKEQAPALGQAPVLGQDRLIYPSETLIILIYPSWLRHAADLVLLNFATGHGHLS